MTAVYQWHTPFVIAFLVFVALFVVAHLRDKGAGE